MGNEFGNQTNVEKITKEQIMRNVAEQIKKLSEDPSEDTVIAANLNLFRKNPLNPNSPITAQTIEIPLSLASDESLLINPNHKPVLGIIPVRHMNGLDHQLLKLGFKIVLTGPKNSQSNVKDEDKNSQEEAQ